RSPELSVAGTTLGLRGRDQKRASLAGSVISRERHLQRASSAEGVTRRAAMAGDRRGGGAPGAQFGRPIKGAPGGQDGRPVRRWKDDDPRTAVVRDVLRAVISGLVAETGRARLDIVDAGGGTGGFAVPLAGLGHTVTVIDPSPDSLAAAQRRAAEIAVPLQAIQGDVTDLPGLIGEQGADLVLCHSVLEYVDVPAAAMAAISRVLRPGGAVSVLATSAVAAVIHRALAGRFDEARRLLAFAGGPAGAADGRSGGGSDGGSGAGSDGRPGAGPRRFTLAEVTGLIEGAGVLSGAAHGI